MGKLIQLCLVFVGEFLVCMQFNAKITHTKKQNKKKKKKKKQQQKKNRPWSDAIFCVICWISPEIKVVKFKFGQIHLNEVFVGEFLQSLGYRFACS